MLELTVSKLAFLHVPNKALSRAFQSEFMRGLLQSGIYLDEPAKLHPTSQVPDGIFGRSPFREIP